MALWQVLSSLIESSESYPPVDEANVILDNLSGLWETEERDLRFVLLLFVVAVPPSMDLGESGFEFGVPPRDLNSLEVLLTLE